jgi:RNA polymerase sigma factor (sigma-70 family)
MSEELRTELDSLAGRLPSLLRLATFLLGDVRAAEDVCQDVVAAVLPRLASIENVDAYLRTAVVNGCRRMLRRRHTLDRALGRLHARVPAASHEEIEELVARDAFFQALRSLTPAQRTVIVLTYYEDLGPDQVARVLTVPVGTVKSHLARGLVRLRKELS